jgi:hypothetical protein
MVSIAQYVYPSPRPEAKGVKLQAAAALPALAVSGLIVLSHQPRWHPPALSWSMAHMAADHLVATRPSLHLHAFPHGWSRVCCWGGGVSLCVQPHELLYNAWARIPTCFAGV